MTPELINKAPNKVLFGHSDQVRERHALKSREIRQA